MAFVGRTHVVNTSTQKLESLDFSIADSAVTEAYAAARSVRDYRTTNRYRWVLIVCIGAATAVVAAAITVASAQLTELRQHVVDGLIDAERKTTTPAGTAFAAFVGMCAAYAAGAALLVAYIEPVAGGSGIPEIKALLNGFALPRVLRIRTLLVKACGNALSVASGLPVGKEGPMVHTGAILASAFSQGTSRICGRPTRWLIHEPFRNDREKRDFVACGAAAGVAAAFGAPVGGLLFAIEEGTTHWYRSLVWRTLLCSIVAAFVVAILLSGIRGVGWGVLDVPGMLSFGAFEGTAWRIWELPLFMLVGGGAGLVGACFNAISRRLGSWRRTYVPVASPLLRVLEVVVVCAAIASAKFGVALALGQCVPLPTPPEDGNDPISSAALLQFYCARGTYNDLASLLMANPEETVKRLFHAESAFVTAHLAIFLAFYAASAALTYGVAVPSGLFIPALLMGAAMGRLAGVGARVALGMAGAVNEADEGVYALVGAAAMLGGTTRMTVSIAVILLECTGNLSYALPLMLTLMTSRWTGNLFNDGIYDTHIALAGWPLLGESPGGLDEAAAGKLRVTDVMTPASQLRTLPQVCTVREAAAALAVGGHSAFPVRYSDDMMREHPRLGNLAGLVKSRHVAELIARGAVHAAPPAVPLHAAGVGVASLVSATVTGLSRVRSGSASSSTASAVTRSSSGRGTWRAAGAASLLSDVAFTAALGSYTHDDDGKPQSARRRRSMAGRIDIGSNDGIFGAGTPAAAIAWKLRSRRAGATGASPEASALQHQDVVRRPLRSTGDNSFNDVESVNIMAPLLGSGSGGPPEVQPQLLMPLPRPVDSVPASDAAVAVEVADVGTAAVSPSIAPRGASQSPPLGARRGARPDSAATEASAVARRRSTSATKARRSDVAPPGPPSRSGSISGGSSASAVRIRQPSVPSFYASGGAVDPLSVTLHRGGDGGHVGGNGSSSGTESDVNSGALRDGKDPARRTRRGRGNRGLVADDAGRSGPHRQQQQQPVADQHRLRYGAPPASADPYGDLEQDLDAMHRDVERGDDAGVLFAATKSNVRGNAVPARVETPTDKGREREPLLSSGSARKASPGDPFAAGAPWDDRRRHAVGKSSMRRSGSSVSSARRRAATENRDRGDVEELLYTDEPLLTHEELEMSYPHTAAIAAAVEITPPHFYIDLRPYLNPAPYTIHVHAPLDRAYDLFRSLGLSHLLVINDAHDVVGLVTRQDLAGPNLRVALERKRRRVLETQQHRM